MGVAIFIAAWLVCYVLGYVAIRAVYRRDLHSWTKGHRRDHLLLTIPIAPFSCFISLALWCLGWMKVERDAWADQPARW